MEIKHGWLLKDDELSWTVGGIAIDPATRTRREEYHWINDHVGRGRYILDAAAGYVPTWHEMPTILAHQDYDVVAVDFDQRSLNMPYVNGVIRMLGDITSLPFADKSFDTVVCISVLEHLSIVDVSAAIHELVRVCRKQLLLTADYGNWLPTLFDLPEGDVTPAQPQLSPSVYFLEAQL